MLWLNYYPLFLYLTLDITTGSDVSLLMTKPCIMYQDLNHYGRWKCKLHNHDAKLEGLKEPLDILGLSSEYQNKYLNPISGATTLFSYDARVSETEESITFLNIDTVVVGTTLDMTNETALINEDEHEDDLSFSLAIHYKQNFTANNMKRQMATPRLVYYGGPIVPNVKVVTIWWGGDVRYAKELEKFYGAVTNSSWYRIFAQYSTASAKLGPGKWLSSYNFSNAPRGTITSTQIRSYLRTLINNGLVPASDGNTYYAIHFAPGINIAAGSSTSCVEWCAYHSTMWRNGGAGTFPYVYFGVMPDQGGGCSWGCGRDSVPLNNLYAVSSHELAEVVTDPAVGFAYYYSSPLAWYSQIGGEVADICNSYQGQTLGADGVVYTIQQQWSNLHNSCIGNMPSPPTRKPTRKPSVSKKPVIPPTRRPTKRPSVKPSKKPTSTRTAKPTAYPTIPPPIVTTNLVASYDPATGISDSILEDSSGNGYHAQVFGDPKTATVRGFPVLRLNGTSQYYYYTAGYASTLLGGSVTFDVWFNSASSSTPQTILSEYGRAGLTTDGWRDAILGLMTARMRGGVYDGSTTAFVSSRGSFSANTWYNLVLTYSSGVIRMYVNGVLQGSAARKRKTTPSTLYYAIGHPDKTGGRYLGGVSKYFNGYIGVVKFYSVALSQSQITQNYLALRWRYSGPTARPITKPTGIPSLEPTIELTTSPT